MGDAVFRLGVSLDVVTGTGQASRNRDAVRTLFQRLQDFQRIGAAGARQFDNLDRRRITHAPTTREVSG